MLTDIDCQAHFIDNCEALKFAEFLETKLNATIDPETLPIVRELREKLERYEKAEQEGRLIELPCKIGDTVWVTTCATSRGIEVVKCEVRKMRIKNDGKTIGYSCCGRYKSGYLYNGNFVFNSIGKTVFLTREEAEAALKEREE